jgi:hypothetical protein
VGSQKEKKSNLLLKPKVASKCSILDTEVLVSLDQMKYYCCYWNQSCYFHLLEIVVAVVEVEL